MWFTVGGESYDLTKEQVIRAMKDAPVETIHKHVVDIEGELFPPKQVFATVTRRERQSFTTMEAQRVLSRLGFVCRRVGLADGRTLAWEPDEGDLDGDEFVEKLTRLEGAVATIQVAIAGIDRRLSKLEAS